MDLMSFLWGLVGRMALCKIEYQRYFSIDGTFAVYPSFTSHTWAFRECPGSYGGSIGIGDIVKTVVVGSTGEGNGVDEDDPVVVCSSWGATAR